MLAVVDNQVANVTPALTPISNFELITTPPDPDGRGRVAVYADNQLLESGVIFYRMNNDRHSMINPRSGEYQVEKGNTTFRAVFLGRHLEVEVNR